MKQGTQIIALFHLEPSIDGGLGEKTEIGPAVDSHIPNVERLEYTFEDWSGDELLTSHPCYLISTYLWEILAQAGVSGIEKDHVIVSKSEQFELDGGEVVLPEFVWLRPTGRVTELPRSLMPSRFKDEPIWSGHDVCLGPKAELIMSIAALNALDLSRLKSCKLKALPCWQPSQ